MVKIAIIFIFFQLPTRHENPYFWLTCPLVILFHIMYFYSIYSILFPLFFKSSRYTLFIAFTVLISVVHCIGLWWVWSGFSNLFNQTPDAYLSGFIGANFIFFSVSFTWRYLNFLIVNTQKKYFRTNELKTSELNFLKAQINPHFLFNTLGCINGLALTNSAQTGYAIKNFNQLITASSKMKGGIKIDFQHELNFLKNYINLQQIRYSVPVSIEFPEIDENQLYIEPLLILPLIENVFKCGDVSDEGFITVKCSIQNNDISVSIRNMTNRNNTSGDLNKNLEKLKKRLEIIYPKKFNLFLKQYPDNFISTLNLTLDEK